MTPPVASYECADDRRELLSSISLFSDLKTEVLDWVLSRCRIERVASGEWCVREGDLSDGLYIVVYGRLQVHVNGTPTDQISRGHVFGELGMITGKPRAAGVSAVRDSEVLVLPAADFDQLADEQPGWMRRVAQIVVDRLVAPERRAAPDRVLTLVVMPMDGVGSVRDLALSLASRLGHHPNEAVVVAEDDAPPLADRARWTHQLESAHRFVVYDGSSTDDAWTRWCSGHSDRLVLVMDAEDAARSVPASVERMLPERIRAGTVSLLVLHPQWTRRPRGVSSRPGSLREVNILNARRGHSGDLGRAARLLAGRGCGLVLGGGGPRGFAHLGVMRALDEAEIPVDVIGGTSIGAVMGSFRALDLDASTREAWALNGFVESGNLFPPTLPLLSFSSARKVRDLLESSEYLGDRLIEETWLPFFCISANLTRAEIVVHDRGSLATAVRASLSLPGIFPPVRSGSDFLVDGGVLNNLPVDIMRERFTTGPVVAVDLVVDEELNASPGYRETPSGWTLLINRLARRAKGDATPLSLNVLMRAKELAGIRAQREILAGHPPDVLIQPDMSGASMFDFKRALHLIESGYRETIKHLEEGDLAALADTPALIEDDRI
ncbi:MAG: patatin-like phospholipase family protein [Acidimicrobiales bacterium]